MGYEEVTEYFRKRFSLEKNARFILNFCGRASSMSIDLIKQSCCEFFMGESGDISKFEILPFDKNNLNKLICVNNAFFIHKNKVYMSEDGNQFCPQNPEDFVVYDNIVGWECTFYQYDVITHPQDNLYVDLNKPIVIESPSVVHF